jgi:hypothetical protein
VGREGALVAAEADLLVEGGVMFTLAAKGVEVAGARFETMAEDEGLADG